MPTTLCSYHINDCNSSNLLKVEVSSFQHIQGGLIAAHACIQRQDMFAGLVLSAPAVKPVVMNAVTAAIVVRLNSNN